MLFLVRYLVTVMRKLSNTVTVLYWLLLKAQHINVVWVSVSVTTYLELFQFVKLKLNQLTPHLPSH